MKTFKKTLCVLLSVLMAFSCISLAASAEGETVNSSSKYYAEKSDTYNAKVTLDKVDEALASMGVYEEVTIIDGVTIVIDMRDVNGLCDTLDLLRQVVEVDGIHDIASTKLIRAALGQLGKDITLANWTTGLDRSNDIKILKNLIIFFKDNSPVISGIISGGYDMGVLNDFVDLDSMLGADGVSGLIKEALFTVVYEKDSPEYTNAYNIYKNDIDAFLYNVLIPHFTKDALPGLTVTASSTVEQLICSVFDIAVDKYVIDAVKDVNIDLSASSNSMLKALDGIVNLKGSTYDFSEITLDPAEDLLDQLNGLFGAIVEQMIPAYGGWVDGGYEMIDDNYEDLLKYIGKKSGILPKADSLSLEELVTEVATLTLSNGDFGAIATGIENCESLEEILTTVMKNLADEWSIGVQYDADDSYLVVLGDMFAGWFYDRFDVKDINGKSYLAGGGKDIFEVSNYFVNYFLFDKSVASVLGLSVKKTDSVFTKIDKLLDYFGETKSKGVSFDSEEFLLGSATTKGLLDSVLTFDLENILDLTVVPALEAAGDVSAIEFIYKSIERLLNNWAGTTVLPAYKNKAFTTALSNSSIANMISAVLATLAARADAVIDSLTFSLVCISGGEGESYTVTKAEIDDCEATGNKVYPEATVTLDGTTLKPGKDYIVKTNAKTPGQATAVIKFIGDYSGSIERSFNLVLGKVRKATCMSTVNSVKLVWDKIPFADGYNIYVLKNGSYKLINDELVTENQFAIAGLSAATEYDVRIDAVSNAYGSSEGAKIDVATIPASINTSTITTKSEATRARLIWSPVASASHYKIEVYLGANKWKEVRITDKTDVIVSALQGYTTYNFRITPLKKLSDGSYIAGASASVNVKTTLGAVTKATVSYTSNSITIKWDAVKNAQAYQLLQYKGGKWVSLGALNPNTTSYKITGLKAATKYQYAVRAAVKENGKWIYGGSKIITQYTGLLKPTTFKVSATSASAVKIAWSKVASAKSYEVFQYIGGKWVSKGLTKNTTATINGLPSGTKAHFKVRAVTTVDGKYHYGDLTDYVTGLTLPGKVTNVKLVKRTTNAISFSWSKVTGATSYQIFRLQNGSWVSLGTTTSTQYTDSKSLSKSTEYQYKVRAVQKVGSTNKFGAASAVFKAKTTLVGSSTI